MQDATEEQKEVKQLRAMLAEAVDASGCGGESCACRTLAQSCERITQLKIDLKDSVALAATRKRKGPLNL